MDTGEHSIMLAQAPGGQLHFASFHDGNPIASMIARASQENCPVAHNFGSFPVRALNRRHHAGKTAPGQLWQLAAVTARDRPQMITPPLCHARSQIIDQVRVAHWNQHNLGRNGADPLSRGFTPNKVRPPKGLSPCMVMPARPGGPHESGAVPASLTRQKTAEPGTGRVGEDEHSEPHETPRRSEMSGR